MSAHIGELRQHALMVANRTKMDASNDDESVRKAYARAKTFDGEACPECWVNDECTSGLVLEAYSGEVNAYKCKRCGFKTVLPKP